MSKEVQAAIGTQRQFAKQPEVPYALNLNRMSASAGISQRTDLDTQRLQSALGLLGKNIMEERVADEKRTQEQAVLVNADKLLEGKTQEDLKKFDRITALQNSTNEFDLTDNPYAMAALEKGIGKMASTYAKQQWANDPGAQKPKSVSDAVGLYHKYLQENREAFQEDTIQNTTAFDAGYYEGAVQDTLKVADEADKRINDDRRQKMVMLGSSEIQDLVYSGAKGVDFTNGILPALRKIQLGARDRDGFMKAVTPLADMIAAKDFTTERLDALGDYQYEEGLSLKQMINFYPAYEKVGENFNNRVTDDIVNKSTRPDGTIDLDMANKLLSQLPKEFSETDGVPMATLPISAGDNPDLTNLSSNMKGVLPLIGGAIYQLGFKDAQITSGYRTPEHNADVGGVPNSHHVAGEALDIYLGDNIEEADAEKAQAYFSQYFGEVLFHDAGSGRHLHLADYKGGLKGANFKEQSAAAYNPQRLQKLQQAIATQAAYRERIHRQQMQDEKERVSMAVWSTNNPMEQAQIITNSSLPNATKQTMLASINRVTKKAAKGYGDNPEDKYYYNYAYGSGINCKWHDDKVFAEWWAAYKDPNIDPESDEYQKLQKKANAAAARLNEYNDYMKAKGFLPTERPHTEGAIPDDSAPALTQSDVDTAEIKIWANSNPVNSSGVPLSDEEIQNVVDKWALQNDKDLNAIHEEVFSK